MATQVYNDFYSAYNNGKLILTGTTFKVMLLGADYGFSPNHKPEEVELFAVVVREVIVSPAFGTKSMNEIIDIAKAQIKTAITEAQDKVKQRLTELTPDQAQETESLFFDETDNEQDYWRKLSDAGFSKIAIAGPDYMCFTEDID